jgi:hypothetical protein
LSHPLRQSQSADLSPEPTFAQAEAALEEAMVTGRTPNSRPRPGDSRRAGHESAPLADVATDRFAPSMDRELDYLRERFEMTGEFAGREREMRGLIEGVEERREELEHIREVVERMERGGDIPDEWWGSVGLGGLRRGRRGDL